MQNLNSHTLFANFAMSAPAILIPVMIKSGFHTATNPVEVQTSKSSFIATIRLNLVVISSNYFPAPFIVNTFKQ